MSLIPMTTRSRLWLSVCILILSASARAQSSAQPTKPGRLVFSPIPFLTPTALQGTPSGKPVAFFDAAANQILIQLPADGTTLPQRQIRYDIPNGAHPLLAFSVDQSGAGPSKYTYSITDNPRDPQRTQRVEILLPSSDTGLISPAVGWKFASVATTLPDRSSTVNNGTMNAVSWENPSSGSTLVSGISLSIASTYLPGFANAFIAGKTGNPLTRDVLVGQPAALQPQLQQFLESGIGQTSYWVIGPLFKGETSKAVIAANFHFGVSVLIRNGQLDGNSPYISSLIE